MLKSDVQHHFWITKKVFERKLGSKEDSHVLSSDTELENRLAVFQSIRQTCSSLEKCIHQFQEHLLILSQEATIFGRFLNDVGNRSKTTKTCINKFGSAMDFSGKQILIVREPLLRLCQEVSVFSKRAVSDTLLTVQSMEKVRTEYRAALSWMKSVSLELDPDSQKGLEKFRHSQSHVRSSKMSFDNISLKTIQKIDLLAAARCNMFSYALLLYTKELKKFGMRTSSMFEKISAALTSNTKFDFSFLKELSDEETINSIEESPSAGTDVGTKPVQSNLSQDLLLTEDTNIELEPLCSTNLTDGTANNVDLINTKTETTSWFDLISTLNFDSVDSNMDLQTLENLGNSQQM